MKKKGMILLLAVRMLCPGTLTFAQSEEPDNLYAQSAVLMDADSGRILFEKNGREARPMASTTKIMTCILALEEGDLSEEVTVSANAAAQPQVHLGMREGEQYRLEDLLYSLMLESHNDTAVAIAEHIAGSTEGFAALMNERAEAIGCEDTHFVTPNGLDAEDEGGVHSTTAADLARIMRYCITQSEKKEDFLRITQTESHAFSNLDGSRSFSCYNHNAFLGMMDGAISGKTGYTADAGYCYVGALQRGERTFIVTLLACGWPNHKTYKWSDTKALMNYGLENYEYRDVLQETDPAQIPVENGIAQSRGLEDTAFVEPLVEEPESLELLVSEEDEITIKATMTEILEAPVAKDTVIGKITYYLNDTPIQEFPVVASNQVDCVGYGWCLEKILERFWI